jgi:hypothetical protein
MALGQSLADVKSILSLFGLGAGATFALAAFAGAPFGAPLAAATAPPSPPPMSATPVTPSPEPTTSPLPAASAFPLPPGAEQPTPSATAPVKGGKPGATPSPPPQTRVGLDGVWEVQIQHPNITDYTHFKLTQTGSAVTGTYLDGKGKRFPLAGTVSGDAIRMIVTRPDGSTIVMEARLDGTTDMVGMFTTPNEQTPFTAAYRPKEKWIENVNPSPGGLGAPTGGYTPP